MRRSSFPSIAAGSPRSRPNTFSASPPTLRQASSSWTDAEAADMVGALHIGVEPASSPLATINELGPAVVVSDFGNNAGLLLGPEVARLAPPHRRRDDLRNVHRRSQRRQGRHGPPAEGPDRGAGVRARCAAPVAVGHCAPDASSRRAPRAASTTSCRARVRRWCSTASARCAAGQCRRCRPGRLMLTRRQALLGRWCEPARAGRRHATARRARDACSRRRTCTLPGIRPWRPCAGSASNSPPRNRRAGSASACTIQASSAARTTRSSWRDSARST